MKNFKFKLNFLLSLFKKIKIIKKSNTFLEKTKNLIKIEKIKKNITDKYKLLREENFKIYYFIFFVSLIFFYYLIYLSFPGILHNKSNQNYFTKILNEQYGVQFSLTPEISYSILPRPHFQIRDVVIFNNRDDFQKEIAEVKKLKIYLYQKNFLKKENLKIKSIELFETNFFINKRDLILVNKFLSNGFNQKKVIVKRANLFYQDENNSTISYLNLNKLDMFYNDKMSQDILTSSGEIFNIPFNVNWKQDITKSERNTNLKFKKIKLNILNSSKFKNKDKFDKLQIFFNRSKYIVNYGLEEKQISFNSDNSFIGNDKFIFSGLIFLEPFNFDVKSSLDRMNLKGLFAVNSIFKEILSEEFTLNQNFNGNVNLSIKNLEKNPLFESLNIKAKFVGNNLDVSNTIFVNKKIANLIVKNGIFYEDENNLIFKGNLDFEINNLDKLYNKFVVPKKNRKTLKKINFEIIINLTNLDIKIIKITNEDFKNKEIKEIDDLIYEYNSGGIKVTNWIEFKNFTNKIISFYSG